MYLALLPCWGRAYITPQMGGAQLEFTEDEARSYGAFLGARYRPEPHILWVLGGDAKAQTKGYDKSFVVRRSGTAARRSARWPRVSRAA